MAKKFNGKANDKKGNGKTYRKPKPSEKSRSDEPVASGNHISWYVPDVNMLKEVAAIPFNYRTGDSYKLFHDVKYTVPGICTLEYIPTYGDMKDSGSTINVAGTGVYSWIRHQNSGSKNYVSADDMIYLMAMDNVYSGITYFTRLLGVMNNFSRENRYTPKLLLKAMGIDDDNGAIYGEQAEMKYRLNHLITKAATLNVPNTFPLYTRHAFMNGSVYIDEDDPRGQMYIFIPRYLYTYTYLGDDRPDNVSPWVLRPTYFANSATPRKWRTLMAIIETMVDNIYTDEDIGIMSGDIKKAYGDGQLFTLNTVPSELFQFPFTYDLGMLEQIHNATIAGLPKMDITLDGIHGWDIVQIIDSAAVGATEYLKQWKPMAAHYDAVWDMLNGSRLLDLHTGISEEQVMRATRLMLGDFMRVGDDENKATYVFESCGSEMVVAATIYTIENNDGTADGLTISRVPTIADAYSRIGTTTYWDLYDLFRASTFSYFPIMYLNPYQDAVQSAIRPFGNLKYTTAISNENLKQLHSVATLGLFNIPRLTQGRSDNS